MKRTSEVLHDALQLPTGERAEIAAQLLSSLNESDAVQAQAAWAEEITRRAAAVVEGRADSRNWREALDEIDREILGR
ncbi:MAG: addiction module protein [Thermoanaerobaculia bacterium]